MQWCQSEDCSPTEKLFALLAGGVRLCLRVLELDFYLTTVHTTLCIRLFNGKFNGTPNLISEVTIRAGQRSWNADLNRFLVLGERRDSPSSCDSHTANQTQQLRSKESRVGKEGVSP